MVSLETLIVAKLVEIIRVFWYPKAGRRLYNQPQLFKTFFSRIPLFIPLGYVVKWSLAFRFSGKRSYEFLLFPYASFRFNQSYPWFNNRNKIN